MPLCSQRLDNCIGNRLTALFALGAITMSVTIDTPSIPILLHKRRARIKWITTLSTEKMSSMPLSTTCDNDFTLNRCLARLAARRKHLVEVEMAEEALSLVRTVFML
jgi:hypothetical protein